MATKTITVELHGEDDECDYADSVEFPAVWVICSRCDGEGKHVNPAVDGHGITSEEWERDWDEDSREGYFSGRYDVRCEAGCNDGKVMVVDVDHLGPELKAQYDRWQAQEDEAAQSRAEDAYTRRMESGGY